jgi:hypothetical protein
MPFTDVYVQTGYEPSKRCTLRYCTSKKGGEFLVQACSQQVWDTPIGMLQSWCLQSKITQKPLGPVGVDVHIDEFAMHQLEESIHFASTRHESKTVFNDVISVTARMQTQETKWNDSYQAFISKSRLWRISTIIDQLAPLIGYPLLLSDYPTQEGSDLPAMRAWISASTSPPGGVFGRKVCTAYGRPPVWSGQSMWHAGRSPNSLRWTSSWTG